MADGSDAIPGKIQRKFRTMWWTNKTLAGSDILSGTSYLVDGDFVCLDAVNTCHTIDGTAYVGYGVTRPETRNLEAPVGAVRNPPARTGQTPTWVCIETQSTGQVPVNVQADLTGAATTTVRLGPQNGSFALAAIGNMSADAAGMIAVSRLSALRFTNGTDSSGTAAVQNVVLNPTRGF